MKKKIIHEMKYIRYKICRAIYYADQCPVDCRKNPRTVAKTMVESIAIMGMGLVFMMLAVLLA